MLNGAESRTTPKQNHRASKESQAGIPELPSTFHRDLLVRTQTFHTGSKFYLQSMGSRGWQTCQRQTSESEILSFNKVYFISFSFGSSEAHRKRITTVRGVCRHTRDPISTQDDSATHGWKQYLKIKQATKHRTQLSGWQGSEEVNCSIIRH